MKFPGEPQPTTYTEATAGGEGGVGVYRYLTHGTTVANACTPCTQGGQLKVRGVVCTVYNSPAQKRFCNAA
jgi:hypothetical protein